jgi:hypothetical protein
VPEVGRFFLRGARPQKRLMRVDARSIGKQERAPAE